MLGADVVVVELARLFEGELDDALRARREDHLLLHGLAAATDDRFDLLPHLGKIDAERLEHFRRKTLAFGDDAEQNVLGPDVIVSETLRFFLSEHDAASRSLGERFPHRHIVIVPNSLRRGWVSLAYEIFGQAKAPSGRSLLR